MATRPPLYWQLKTATIQDRERAKIHMLQTADDSQHALMTGRGGPSSWMALSIEADTIATGVTGQVLYRVPPGVTHVHVMALTTGVGTLRVTSRSTVGADIDDEGSLIKIAKGDSSTMDQSSLVWSAVIDDTLTNSPRAVTVSSSVVWEWQTVILDVEVTPSSSPNAPVYHAQVWGLGVIPLHVPRDAT